MFQHQIEHRHSISFGQIPHWNMEWVKSAATDVTRQETPLIRYVNAGVQTSKPASQLTNRPTTRTPLDCRTLHNTLSLSRNLSHQTKTNIYFGFLFPISVHLSYIITNRANVIKLPCLLAYIHQFGDFSFIYIDCTQTWAHTYSDVIIKSMNSFIKEKTL